MGVDAQGPRRAGAAAAEGARRRPSGAGRPLPLAANGAKFHGERYFLALSEVEFAQVSAALSYLALRLGTALGREKGGDGFWRVPGELLPEATGPLAKRRQQLGHILVGTHKDCRLIGTVGERSGVVEIKGDDAVRDAAAYDAVWQAAEVAAVGVAQEVR